jgi:putative nucleotidyltransferase with HDIG domain
MSIRLLTICLTAVLLSLIFGSGYWLNHIQTSETIREVSRQELELLAESIRHSLVNVMNAGADGQALDEHFRSLAHQQPGILDLRVIRGVPLTRQFGVRPKAAPRDEIDRRVIDSDSPIIVEVGKHGQEKLRFGYPLKAEGSCLRCHAARLGDILGGVSLEIDVSFAHEKIIARQRQQLLLAIGEALALLILLAIVGNRLIFHPLLRLAEGAKRLASGDFSRKVDGVSGNEIGTLIRIFNDMTEQIRLLMERQDNLIREQAIEVAELVEMGQLLGSSSSEADLLSRFAKSLTDSAKVTWCRIAILNDAAALLEVKAVYSLKKLSHEEQRMTVLREKQCPKLWQLMHVKQFAIIQRQDDLSAHESRLLFSGQETNVLCIPIVHKDVVRGIAIFGEFRSPERDPLDDRKVYLCRAMVNLIGSAIEITHLISHLLEQSEEVVLAMAEAVEKKSPWTAGHSKRVTQYALMIAKAMGSDAKSMEELRITGLLHDIGKIGLPGLILNKAGKLTEEEYALVKRHPEDGAQILSRMHMFHKLIPAIRHHHEWYNGQGYPDGVRGLEIPANARILAVADAFDAMTADRPYRKGLASEEAMRRLQEGAGEQFDPELVEIFRLAYHD